MRHEIDILAYIYTNRSGGVWMMSEYRRFVAYIYAYQEGEKQRNAGYVKADIREHVCRMQIQMQTGNPVNSRFSVYGFVRVEDVILAIPLGGGDSENGNFDIRLSMGTENLNETGYHLEQIRGIWLKDEKENDYISVWDDEGIDVKKFALDLPEKIPEQNHTEEVAVMESKMPDESQKGSVSESCLAARWQNFMNHYPKIRPFEDGMMCLKITPKDISFLGEEEWKFGQNPFLRQGFLRYGHLILARQADGRFLLGVPGMYYDMQDHHLARMYGFDEFRKVDYMEDIRLPEGEEPEKFGYWYHFVKC